MSAIVGDMLASGRRTTLPSDSFGQTEIEDFDGAA